jgi:RNA polymerase sigma-54 factor
MGQSISLQLQRTLSIAPALQRSLQLLQMNALEFEQEISQALSNNPLLEMDEGADGAASDGATVELAAADGASEPNGADALDSDAAPYDGLNGSADATLYGDEADGYDAPDSYEQIASDALADLGQDFDSFDAADADAGSGADAVMMDGELPGSATPELTEAAGDEFNEHLSDWSTNTRASSGDGLSALDMAPSLGSLRDHLLEQLGALRIGELDRRLCEVVIDSLDPAGYLRESLADLYDLIVEQAGGRKLPVELADLQIALQRVQSFEPAGVGARSMEECLKLQLRVIPDETPGKAIAQAIVESHLQLLARNDFRGIAAATGADESDLSAATRLIRSLDPKPGLGFGRDRVVFAVPEVIVKKVKGTWVAALHPGATPRIRLNAQYASIVARNEGGQCSGLSAQLQEAKWLMRSIEQRANTIEKTAAAIVARQQAFFEHGDIGLQPLKLADIAADVGIHESTVSRVVNSKYLQCPAGLIPMRRFFTSHVETAAGDACSATAVKAMIRQLVESESPAEPLSDHRLAKLLAQRGIRIARRTVTKYRDALGIEAADLRRQLHHPAAEAAAAAADGQGKLKQADGKSKDGVRRRVKVSRPPAPRRPASGTPLHA